MTHAFVGIPVTNYASARTWYEQFFGRPPDVVPKEDEAVWHVTTTGLIYIVADRLRAGRGLVVLAAVFHDPDGNTIKVFAASDT